MTAPMTGTPPHHPRAGSTTRSARSRPTPTAAPTPTCTSTRCRRSGAIDLYLKDESVHPTGSLKHRLARSLFLYALVNGWITEGTTVVEASSGSTAVSEAYFARMLGLPFVAVMPRRTSVEKIALIEAAGGTLSLRRRPGRHLRRGPPGRRRRRRPLHGPVHLLRAGDRLARQQQHRRVDLRAARAGAASDPELDRRRGRHRRDQRDHRAVPALPAAPHPAGRRRPGELVVLRGLADRGPELQHRRRLPDRGHRPAPGGAVVHAVGDRPDGAGARRRLDRGDAVPAGADRAARRRVDRAPTCGRRSGWPPGCTRSATGGASSR